MQGKRDLILKYRSDASQKLYKYKCISKEHKIILDNTRTKQKPELFPIVLNYVMPATNNTYAKKNLKLSLLGPK